MATTFSPSELSYAAHPLSHSTQSKPFGESLLRSDARAALAYRDIGLETGVAQGTIGSARVIVEGAGGSTEIWAAVRGEVEDLNETDGEGMGKVVVNVECAPTAIGLLKPDLPLHLAALLQNLFSAAALPHSLLASLLVIPRRKAWTLYLDVLILSATAGNVIDLAIIAARSALAVTRVPETIAIGYEAESEKGIEVGGPMQGESGITGLVKGGKAGRDAIDFELVEGGWEAGLRLKGWEELPIALTFNLINQLPHLDATPLEEQATSSQLVFCFTSSGDLCGVRQLGEGEVEYARLMPLLGESRKLAGALIKVLNNKLRGE